jgi:hypothetical protein
MKEKELKKLVDTAVALHREIGAKTEQLKRYKLRLVEEARLHPEALTLTESGGARWTAEGTDGCIARVNFPAPGIVAGIGSEAEAFEKIQASAGDKFRRLFMAVKIFQPVQNFREHVAALLPAPKAQELISLCENQVAPRVSFEVSQSSENKTGVTG